jgi:hypothetical protein
MNKITKILLFCVIAFLLRNYCLFFSIVVYLIIENAMYEQKKEGEIK